MRRRKTDRVPNFEDMIMERVTSAVLGKPRSDNRSLPIADAIELAGRVRGADVGRGVAREPSIRQESARMSHTDQGRDGVAGSLSLSTHASNQLGNRIVERSRLHPGRGKLVRMHETRGPPVGADR